MPIGRLVSTLIAILLGTVGLVLTRNVLNGIDLSDVPPAVKSMIEFLPILIVPAIILMNFSVMNGPVETISRTLMWSAFGNRMKEAYSAKFGGPNSSFNEEVDAHIKAVKVLGKGYTKSLEEDWLKRMAQFVEIPYVVPEEEYKSEEEKTIGPFFKEYSKEK